MKWVVEVSKRTLRPAELEVESVDGFDLVARTFEIMATQSEIAFTSTRHSSSSLSRRSDQDCHVANQSAVLRQPRGEFKVSTSTASDSLGNVA